MNIKDKLTICLVLILVIALGFVLKSDASGSVMGQTSDRGLALLAKNDINTFIMTNPDSSSWFTQSLDTFIGASQRDATIKQSSATCLYEEEAYTDGSKYHITNVININWDPSINDYHAYGWWHDPSKPNGIAQGELTSINRDYNKLLQLDIFLQAMYNSYTSNKTYFTTTEKSAMKSYFYKGIERGGFLTVDDGVGLNIDPSFLGVWNGEALTYQDPASSYNAQDLINQYSANNNTGVGLTINGESTCIKQKDTDGNYTIFGPFNIHFVRQINSVSIVGDAKSHTDYNGGQIYYSTSYNKYDTAEWSNQLSNIPANTNFYIKISDSGQEFYNQSPNITITFNQKSIQTYQGRMILLKSGGHGQNLMIYAARKNDPYTASVQYSVEKKDNTLRIVKYGVNGSQETRQTGVGFIINHAEKGYLKYNNGNQIVQIGKMDYNETDFSWISDRNSATIFETVNTDDGWEGYFQITKMPAGKYYIGEIYNKNKGYEDSSISVCRLERIEGDTLIDDTLISDIQSNENISVNIDGVQLLDKIHVATINLEEDGYTKALRVYDSLQSDFNIYMNKVNPSGKYLGGAQFKIRVYDGSRAIGWLYYDIEDKVFDYNNKYKNSTTWITGKGTSKNYTVYAKEQGKLSILGLDTQYKYKIYEFKPATNYLNLLAQTTRGMKVTIDGKATKMTRDANYVSKTSEIDADSIYCGTVSYKDNGLSVTVEVTNVDSISGSPEYVDISGRVWEDTKKKSYNNTYDSGDNALSGVTVILRKSSNGNEAARTTTNSGGKFTFSGSNIRITSGSLSNYYIELSYNKIGNSYRIVQDGTGSNASKAKYQSTGLAWTDNIDSTNRLYMNIGLRALPKETQSVEKWVDNIKVVMKGHEYTYKYGKDNSSVGGVSNVGVGSASYYRTIYASDLAYSLQEKVTDGLKVYITYKIKVTNNTSTYEPARIVGNIKEEHMTVTLKDEYDTKYYELSDSNWSGNNGTATYRSSIKLYRYGTSGYTTTKSITFKLTDKNSKKGNALKEILEKGSFTAGNKVTISGKHQYKKYTHHCGWYSCWNSWDTYYSSYEEENYAPGMTFSIYEFDTDTVAQRTISGKVFEDNNIKSEEDGQILGNGKYDQTATKSENLVQDVTVELLQANNNKTTGQGEVAARYVYDDSQENKYIKKTGDEAKEKTAKDGTYTFTGIIPGDYYVKFTYGDGSQTIIKTNPSGTEAVTAYEYKSTIITNSTLKDMIKKDMKKQKYSNYYWYRNTSILSNNLQYSTAVDVLGDREALNNQSSKKYNMRAYTPSFKISIENENSTSGTSQPKEYRIENMNFGIIDTPEISLGFEKVMSNIKVTNTQGNVIIDGNPAKQEIKYLSNLDDKEAHLTQGSDYAKIEIKDEEIYGAKLEITYAITVINDSNVNYYENSDSQYYGYYYMFGETYLNASEKHKTREVNITIEKVNDYLDSKLTLSEIVSGHGISNKDTYKEENNTLSIDQNWKKLYSKKRAETASRPTKDTAKILVTRTLANNDDMDFENWAQVMKIKVTDEPKLVENVNIHKSRQYTNYFNYEESDVYFGNPSEISYLTITPPTGSDMMTAMIYIVVASIAGIIITIGIIVIKKKVI